MLGGSAVHFALAASFFDEVHVVGPVGDDFGEDSIAVLARRGVQTGDIERVAGGRTFFWSGVYGWDLNDRETLDTQLNVFADFAPKLSERSRACRCRCSWRTSSRICSGRSAPSAPAPGSSRSTR